MKRNAFHNVKIKGKIASGDVNAAKSYLVEFTKIIQDGGYVPDQIFNADETGLYSKKMSTRTYIVKTQKTCGALKFLKIA